MHDPEKSDSGTVATKPTNKAGRLAEEPAERRPETQGNADQQSTHRTQSRVSVSQALERIRQVGSSLLCRLYPRWEPYAGKPHVRFCAGCALKAHGSQSPEMATAVELSRQPRTKSCVMTGNGHCEA
jgi:hypothetical protein